jgi:NAD(P)-dependent dehydrogenase (short-subunit alcohol dehydrogenase family)
MDLFNIEDKVIVVTGGMGQLGSNFVKYLLMSKAKVVILDIVNDQKLAEEKFGLDNESLLILDCDITSKSAIEDSLVKIKEYYGRPFGLINNAALDSPPNSSSEENGPFENFPEESWDKVMEVNSKGVFLLSQVIGGDMAKSGKGSIINISSIYGVVSPNQNIYNYRRKDNQEFYKPVAYSASKSSILNFTRYLATYWAKSGIRVNNLILGGVYNYQDEEFLEAYNNAIPIGRMANEDEYNGAILFLLSDASSYMTGSNLTIDGGWTAW